MTEEDWANIESLLQEIGELDTPNIEPVELPGNDEIVVGEMDELERKVFTLRELKHHELEDLRLRIEKDPFIELEDQYDLERDIEILTAFLGFYTEKRSKFIFNPKYRKGYLIVENHREDDEKEMDEIEKEISQLMLECLLG